MTDRTQQLIADLKSVDSITKKYAAEDLGELRDDRAISHLIDLFEDEEISVQEAAVEAIIKIGGSDAVRKVAPLLRSERASVRNMASDILSHIGEEAIDELSVLIHDNDHDVRKFAVDILGLIGSTEATKKIIEALEDKHINVVCGAVEALGNIGDKYALDALIKLLETAEDPWLQFMLVESIGKMRDSKSLDVLHDMLKQNDPLILASVIRSLGEIKDPLSVKPLIDMLDTIAVSLKQVVVGALDKIESVSANNVFESLDASYVLDKLIPLLNSENAQTRQSIANILKHIQDEKSIGALFSLLKDSNSDVVAEAKRSMLSFAPIEHERLEAYLQKAKNDELKELISILNDLSDNDLSNILLKYLAHEDPEIRSKAVESLGKNKSQVGTEKIIELTGDSNREVQISALRALVGKQDTTAIQTLIQFLTSTSPELTRVAADSLKCMQLDDGAVNELIDLLDVDQEITRVMAASILAGKST